MALVTLGFSGVASLAWNLLNRQHSGVIMSLLMALGHPHMPEGSHVALFRESFSISHLGMAHLINAVSPGDSVRLGL